MVSKIITEGNKVELQRSAAAGQAKQNGEETEVKTFYSLVSEVIDDDRIKITMPLEKGRIVPLPVNGRFNACFYTTNGLYQARVIVVDRFKEENIYMLVIELVTDLVKFQRRQYYRLGCTMEIYYRKIEDEQQEFDYNGESDGEKTENQPGRDEDYKEGVALDISGGGIRFMSEEALNVGDRIFLVIEIQYDESEKKTYGLNGKIVKTNPMENRKDKYEHRVEYKNIDGKVRESLIKYIFDEERRQRKRGSAGK